MRTLVCFCALAWLAASPLTIPAATLVTQYWPMNEGDIRFFSGAAGASYLEFIQDEFGDSSLFSMEIYSQERPGEDYEHYGKSTYGYSQSADTLINYGQRGPIGAYLHFQPPWALLTDGLLAKGGTKSSRFSAVVAVVQVKSVGTVTVPAGTFHDCRSVSFTIKLAARGGVVGGQAMILAPGAGLIKLGVANVHRLAIADRRHGRRGGRAKTGRADSPHDCSAAARENGESGNEASAVRPGERSGAAHLPMVFQPCGHSGREPERLRPASCGVRTRRELPGGGGQLRRFSHQFGRHGHDSLNGPVLRRCPKFNGPGMVKGGANLISFGETDGELTATETGNSMRPSTAGVGFAYQLRPFSL